MKIQPIQSGKAVATCNQENPLLIRQGANSPCDSIDINFGGLFRNKIPKEFKNLPPNLLKVLELKENSELIKALEAHPNKDLKDDVIWVLQAVMMNDPAIVRDQPELLHRLAHETLPEIINSSSKALSKTEKEGKALRLISTEIAEAADKKRLAETLDIIPQLLTRDSMRALNILGAAWADYMDDHETRPEWLTVFFDHKDNVNHLGPKRLNFLVEILDETEDVLLAHHSKELKQVLEFIMLPIGSYMWEPLLTEIYNEDGRINFERMSELIQLNL